MWPTLDYKVEEQELIDIITIAPVGVSNRHIHLSGGQLAALFGENHELKVLKPLSQQGEFAAAETVTIVGPRGVLECVRVLGPVRSQTQIEISMTDGYRLGVKPPVRDSGDLEGTPGVVVVGPRGAVTLTQGVILAARHVHMGSADAKQWRLSDGDKLKIQVSGVRAQLLDNVLVRIKPNYRLEIHLDTDEANAALLKSGDQVHLLH